MKKNEVEQPCGRLGVLVVGVGGAVATTFIAGTLCVRKGVGMPIGSITQMATMRLGKRDENHFPKIKEIVPLTNLKELVFGGWDIFQENTYEAAKYAAVLGEKELEAVKEELEEIRPMPAVFDQNYVKRLHGTWVKKGASKWDLMQQLREDIRRFKSEKGCDRIVVIWCGSTEVFTPPCVIHEDLSRLEEALKNSAPEVSPSICYAYAALSEGAPFINGAPNLTLDFPAMWELAEKQKLPICGKDFKTGQTLLKTVLAPMFKTRMLGIKGWFSTNILGNRDGEVLDDPGSFKTKEESKLSVIRTILQPNLYPELYGDIFHKVRINYYPPRGDNKEGWDNIDLFGWMGYPMQMKVDFLCRDSILAAPLCLDLVLLMDLAHRCGFTGTQSWLSFYFKSPMHPLRSEPEHDLFIQYIKLKNTLRMIIGEPTLDYID